MTTTLSIVLGVCAGGLIGWANMLVLKKLIRIIMDEGANHTAQPWLLGGTIIGMFALLFLGALISVTLMISIAAGWTLATILYIILSRPTVSKKR